ncbi:hypothetical protein AAMO2058_001506300 [Amorphochlora amoebiformis]
MAPRSQRLPLFLALHILYASPSLTPARCANLYNSFSSIHSLRRHIDVLRPFRSRITAQQVAKSGNLNDFEAFKSKTEPDRRKLDGVEGINASPDSDFPPIDYRPVVALVGRPNVGKSSLFNRIIGERLAVVDNRAGTTRDRLIAPVTWKNATFDLVDSGGIDWGEEAYETSSKAPRDAHGKPGSREFIREIREQSLLAMEIADLVLIVVDVGKGLLEADKQIVRLFREQQRKKSRAGNESPCRVVVVANKADNERVALEAGTFWELGMGEPLVVSAKHNSGIEGLLTGISRNIPPVLPDYFTDIDAQTIRVALVGKPNVGKSSILNAILGEERAIVSDVAGTTRDSLDTQIPVSMDNGEEKIVNLIDTAGIIKQSKLNQEVDRWSIMRTMRAISRAEVTVMVVDGSQSFSPQDAQIGNMVLDKGRSLLLAVNKWDAVSSDGWLGEKAYGKDEYKEWVSDRFPELKRYVPVVYTSARDGKGIRRLLPLAIKIQRERSKRIPTSILSNLIAEFTANNKPNPKKGGKQLNFLFASQKSNNPPTFEVRFNDASLVSSDFLQGLEDELRGNFGYRGCPIRIQILGRKDR